MNKKKSRFLASIFSLIILQSCNSNQSKNQLFEEFISQLNQINLPYQYNSKETAFGNQISNKFDEVNFNNGPTIYTHLGYFKSDSNTVHILSIHSGDFFENLSVTTFDLAGNKLFVASLSFEDCAGYPPFDDFVSCNEIIKINFDKKILGTSTKIISNSNQQDSLLITYKKFKLWNNGKLTEEQPHITPPKNH